MSTQEEPDAKRQKQALPRGELTANGMWIIFGGPMLSVYDNDLGEAPIHAVALKLDQNTYDRVAALRVHDMRESSIVNPTTLVDALGCIAVCQTEDPDESTEHFQNRRQIRIENLQKKCIEEHQVVATEWAPVEDLTLASTIVRVWVMIVYDA
jgi:hypothetical protein